MDIIKQLEAYLNAQIAEQWEMVSFFVAKGDENAADRWRSSWCALVEVRDKIQELKGGIDDGE